MGTDGGGLNRLRTRVVELQAKESGLPSEAALALSLAKRARELLLGAPGLLYLHFFERRVSPVESSAPRRTIL